MFYIVKQGERIDDIAKKYNCDVNDLREFNNHITNFDNLHPGMRLTIPVINKIVKDEMEYATPLVEDYYEKQVDTVAKTEERPEYAYNYQYAGQTQDYPMQQYPQVPQYQPQPVPVPMPMPVYQPQYYQQPMLMPQPIYPPTGPVSPGFPPMYPYAGGCSGCGNRPQPTPYYYQQNQSYYY